MSTEKRPQLAHQQFDSKSNPGRKYDTYWFADVRAERSNACDCPDFFHRNIVAGDPKHLCVHLLKLASEAQRTLRAELQQGPPQITLREAVEHLGLP